MPSGLRARRGREADGASQGASLSRQICIVGVKEEVSSRETAKRPILPVRWRSMNTGLPQAGQKMAIEGRGGGVVMGVALGKAEMGTGDEADADEGATGGALAHAALADGLIPGDVVDFVAGGAAETAAGEGSGVRIVRVPPTDISHVPRPARAVGNDNRLPARP